MILMTSFVKSKMRKSKWPDNDVFVFLYIKYTLRQMISQLSKSAQTDVEKGQHVRQQLVKIK